MSKVRGDRSFVRLLKQLPDSVRGELRQELDQTGRMLLGRALARVPVYAGKARKGIVPGALKAGLSYRLTPVRLNLKVGLVGKAINKKLFYGRLVEFGHRIANARTGTLKKLDPISGRSVGARLARLKRRREIRVDGVAPRPFLFTTTRQEIYRPFQRMWGEALRRAAAGTTNQGD